jgi:hypothetical protein
MRIFTLSEAGESDLDDIQAFIEEQKSPYIITHSLVEQHEAIDRGLFFKVEEDSRLIAIASVVQVERTIYHEMANALIALDWQGFGLQYELILVRAATLVTQLDDAQRLVSAINPGNGPSLHNVVAKAGFQPCSQFLPDLTWGCGSCTNPEKRWPCCCDCYVLLKEQHRVLAKQFMDRGLAMPLPKSKGQVILEFRCAAARNDRRRKILEAFIDGKDWA